MAKGYRPSRQRNLLDTVFFLALAVGAVTAAKLLTRRGRTEPLPYVTSVTVEKKTTVRLTFRTGESFSLDLKPLMKGPAFDQVFKLKQFDRVRAMDGFGGIEWPNGADIAPEVLWDERPGR